LLFFLRDIKIAHSVFALPFAAAAIKFAQVPWPNLQQLLLMLIAMISARSWAMGSNRYIDRAIDGKNQRTAGRMIPSGKLPARYGLAWSLLWALIFIVTAFNLNTQAGLCSVPLLTILGLYSYTKRFTWLCHWYLGACLGLAPIAVSIALGVPLQLPQLLIGAGVMMWTAGFDIIYALQDHSFDMEHNLYSVPVHFGFRGAITISRVCFVAMVLLLGAAGYLHHCGSWYFCGLAIIAGILWYEQWLVRDGGNIDQAFFTVNSWVGVVFLIFSQLG
jgi:4-hydroxybenzoate polyprenyltransferase